MRVAPGPAQLDAPGKFSDALKTIEYNRSSCALEFSKRYQELFRDRHDFNKRFAAQTKGTIKHELLLDDSDAGDWFRRYFDLLLNEHRFYKRWLVDREVFIQWVRWANDNHAKNGSICGLTYRGAGNVGGMGKSIATSHLLIFSIKCMTREAHGIFGSW